MDSKSGKKPVLKVLSLEDSPMDAELIYEYLCENSNYEIQMHTVSKVQELIYLRFKEWLQGMAERSALKLKLVKAQPSILLL